MLTLQELLHDRDEAARLALDELAGIADRVLAQRFRQGTDEWSGQAVVAADDRTLPATASRELRDLARDSIDKAPALVVGAALSPLAQGVVC